tara:strand:- start:15 stop:1118 length:1104 start_codon:yes stop_codon:yes gene_type:complete
MENMELMEKNFWKNKKVLITGHTGFKGTWLTLLLQKMGADICGYSLDPEPSPNLFRDIYGSSNNNILDLREDILDKSVLKNKVKEFEPELVFHLAAQPLVRESYKYPSKTWETNLIGTLNLLQSLKDSKNKCSIIIITTDKVYKNKEWLYGYKENDELGGHDPYSASKACTEIMVDSWRNSFCGSGIFQTENLRIATARAGNVIGGGDWAKDRIIPDFIKAVMQNKPINIRNPYSRRPWQHVLEPLRGYLMLAKKIHEQNKTTFDTAYNFGPDFTSNKTVLELVEEINKIWRCDLVYNQNPTELHESKKLSLNIEKSFLELSWSPILDFQETITKTINWYKDVFEGSDPLGRSLLDIESYIKLTKLN